jgi:alpha-glucuronidase
MRRKGFFILLFLFNFLSAFSEDGYRLWLRYEPVENAALLRNYRDQVKNIFFKAETPTLKAAKTELETALPEMLDIRPDFTETANEGGNLIIGLPDMCEILKNNTDTQELQVIGNEGFILRQTDNNNLIIVANTDVGLLYGVFRFLQILQQEQPLSGLDIVDFPKTQVRVLNHWDNLDRTVERGYAGFSLWDWFRLPEVIHPRYIDYARANASVGINGTVLTNVNANAQILTPVYLEKLKAIADAFRLETCPEEYLLWFHRVPWNYRVKSGNTLWDEMAYKYQQGVDDVRKMRKTWDSLEDYVDAERFRYVQSLLEIQEKEAVWWRNSCLLYFQTFSNKSIPEGVEQPDKTLEYYTGIRELYMPGHH